MQEPARENNLMNSPNLLQPTLTPASTTTAATPPITACSPLPSTPTVNDLQDVNDKLNLLIRSLLEVGIELPDELIQDLES